MSRSAHTGAALICVAVLLGQAFAAGTGKWEFINYQPRKADPRQVSLWLLAGQLVDNPDPKGAYDRRLLPLMNVQCLDGKPDFFINLQFELAGRTQRIRYSFDGGTAQDETWPIQEGAISIAPVDVVGFVRSLRDKKRLEVELRFDRSSTRTFFDVAGLDEALKGLLPFCQW